MRKGIVWVIVLGMLIALTGCQAAKAKKSTEATPDAAQAVEGQPALGEPITLEDGTVVYPVDPQQVITGPDGSQQVIYQQGPAPQPQVAPQTTPQGTVYQPVDKTGKVVTPAAQPAAQPHVVHQQPAPQAVAPQQVVHQQHQVAAPQPQAVQPQQKVIKTKDNYPPGTIIMQVNGKEQVVLPKGSSQLQPGQPQVVYPEQTAPQVAAQPQAVQPQVVSQQPAEPQAAPQTNVPLGVVYPQQNQ